MVRSVQSLSQQPTIEQLRRFKDLFELLPGSRSLEAAARNMVLLRGWGRDDSNLSRELGNLENCLKAMGRADVKLFERGRQGRPWQPTPAGKAFYREVCDLLEHFDHTVRSPTLNRKGVRVGATNFCINYLLPKALANSDFFAQHPDTDLHFIEGEHWELVDDVISARVDFAIGPWILSGRDCVAQHLCDLHRVLLVHPKHRRLAEWKQQSPLDLQGLATERVCVLTERHQLDFLHQAILPPPRGGGRWITLPCYSFIRRWVQYNLGVALGHREHESDFDVTKLEMIDLPPEIGVTKVLLYFRTEGPEGLSSQAAKDLVTTIRTTFAK